MGISVMLPAKNEASNLDILLPQIIKNVSLTGEIFEIVVIDGQVSEDNTKEICSKYNVQYVNQEEPYFRGAYRTAIRLAKYDKILVLDCDGSHPPDKIYKLYKKFVDESCDVAIGSRYVKGGTSTSSFFPVLMSKILNTTYRLFLNINATDLSSGFKIYNTSLLKQFEFESKNFDLMQEMLVKMRIVKPNLKIGEIPIDFKDRMYGDSKRVLLVFILSFFTTLFKLKWLIIKSKLKR